MSCRSKLALLFSLLYVAVSTLSIYGVYPDDPFYGDWSAFGLLITFPVSIIGFMYRFAELDVNHYFIEVVQLLWWLIISFRALFNCNEHSIRSMSV